MPTGQALYKEVIEEHHARLERISEKRGVARLKRVYDESQAEVAAKLKRLVKSGKGSTFSAHQKRIILAQLTQGQVYVTQKMLGELGDASTDAQRDTLRALTRDLDRLEHKFSGSAPTLPIEDAARFQGVIDKRATSLLKRHESSLSRYGARNVAKIEDALTKTLLQGETPHEAIDRVTEIIDGEWWQGERIVRTELSWAANATQHDGIIAAREVLPDMLKQWREFVSDDGQPLDDRVGVDSLALHLQVATPAAMFQCPRRAPDGEMVSPSLAMDLIEFPPNRPHDRAVLSPWRAGWGVPGWKFVGGRRVPMR